MSTLELATFVSQLEFERLPTPVVEQARTAIQDFLGVSLFVSRNTPWGRTIAEFAAGEGGAAQATIIGHAKKTTPSRAALANGTMALGFEYEDVHLGSPAHPYSAIVSSALAAAEKEKAGGRELIAAVVAGYEVIARTARASGKSVDDIIKLRGLYPTQLFGVLAAAAAAGRILRLGPEKMAMSIGLAGEQSAGTMQSHAEGAWSRRWHGGKAGENGITAAYLARAGFIGPVKILEGENSLYRAFALDFAPQKLTDGLGKSYEIMGVWFKAYSCCANWHSGIDLVLELRKKHNVDPASVRRITVYMRRLSPLHKRKDFPNIIAAQYSAPFCIATAMLKGRVSPSEFTDETIRDPTVVAYAREKVEAEFDDALTARGEHEKGAPCRVVIQLADGRELTGEQMFPKGHPRNPLSREELRAKFSGLASTVLPEAKVNRLYRLIQTLDEVEDVSRLTALLRRPD